MSLTGYIWIEKYKITYDFYSPGFILTVDDGRCDVDPGENDESTVDDEEW